MGESSQDRVPGWKLAALPEPEEPRWYADDNDPGWDPGAAVPDPDDPVWDAPDIDDPDDCPPQGAAFAEGGWADGLAPGPVLATLVDLVQRDGLGRLDDDQLTGVLQAANRLAAWSAAVRIAAVSGLAAAARPGPANRGTGGRLIMWMMRSRSR
jgi:hypothetical protein